MHPKITTGRVAIYARYSSDRQSETSIEDQVRRARDVITRAGGDPEKAMVYPDFAISGASMARPGLEEMMRAVERGQIDVILTEDISRISRDMADSAQIFKRLQFAGVPLISISDGIDTSQKHAKLNFAVKSLLADLYLDDLRDKTLRGLEGRHLAGFATGQVPYGYKTVPRKDRYGHNCGSDVVIDKGPAGVVLRVFEMYRDGAAFHFIANTLIREGVPSARTRTRHTCFGWGAPGIMGMLRQEKYIGVWRFKETQWIKEPGTNRRIPRKRPPEEVITVERPDLRIVDQELWQEVQERLVARRTKQRGSTERTLSARRSKYLLSGIVVCDECGKPLTIYGPGPSYYRCQTNHSKGSCSSVLRVREDLLVKECFEAIRDQVQTPANIAYVREQIEERVKSWSSERENELVLRRGRLARAEARIRELVDFVAAGHGTKRLAQELQQLEAQVEAETAAVEKLERQAKERPQLPSPDAITAQAFRVHDLLKLAVDRARHVLTGWLKDGEIRVRATPAGFELQGAFYPLLMVAPANQKQDVKKPKEVGSLGTVRTVVSSGGRI